MRLKRRLASLLVFPVLLLAGCPDDGVAGDTEADSDDGTTGAMTTAMTTMTTMTPTTMTTMGMDTTAGDDDDDTTAGGDDDDDDDDSTTTGDDDDDDDSTTAGEGSTTAGETTAGETTAGESTTSQETCGDDMVDGDDVCDGIDLGGEDCISQGFDGGTLGCLDDCSAFDTSACTMVTCGDDMIDGTDVCDGIDLDDQDCVSQGFDSGTLACTADCTGFDTSGCANFGGDCCAANATPGCDDDGCTGAICAADPFCCDDQWDDMCAGAALMDPACVGVGGSCPFEGDCCAANGSPGCEDDGCTTAICGADPFCCDNTWDDMCAGAALMDLACVGVGGSCPDPFEGDCCAANGTPGCDDVDCTTVVCGADPFCCDSQWDITCANAATAEVACQGLGGACPGFGDCLNNPEADVCGPGEVCVSDMNMNPTAAVCALFDCAGTGDCPPSPPGGDAPAQCVDVTGDSIADCTLGCSLGETCPTGMSCFAGFLCTW